MIERTFWRPIGLVCILLFVGCTERQVRIHFEQAERYRHEGKVDLAIEEIADSLQDIGAIVSRMAIKENTLRVAITNTEATKSRIFDTDIAREQLESTKLQILQQTSTAQLAQANVSPQNVLALFQ